MNTKQVVASAFTLIAIDAIYLKLMSNFFGNLVKKIQKSNLKFKFLGAVICYFFIVLSINYFILSQNKGVFDAFILGLCIYGIYESTNYAIFDDWNLKALVVDTLWGGILYASTTYVVNKYF